MALLALCEITYRGELEIVFGCPVMRRDVLPRGCRSTVIRCIPALPRRWEHAKGGDACLVNLEDRYDYGSILRQL